MGLYVVLVLLSACVAMFVVNRPRMDAVALLALIALPIAGVVTAREAVAGFGDPSVVLIAAMFVIGEGLVRTGVAERLGDLMIRGAGGSETRLLILLMVSAATLGSVMSSTGVVAILIPVVLGMAARLDIRPGRLLMPLSMAALISGMLTLVGTPPNMVVDSALRRAGFEGLSFFSVTPVGLSVLVLAVLYMLAARRLLGNRPGDVAVARRRGVGDLIEAYALTGRGRALQVADHAPAAGRTLQDLALRERHQLNVIGVSRRARFETEVLSPGAQMELRPGDVLLVDGGASDATALTAAARDLGLIESHLHENFFTDGSRQVALAELLVPPESNLIGKTVRDGRFRSRFDVNVVGLRRDGRNVPGDVLGLPLKLGDTLLVAGAWRAIRRLRGETRDVLLLPLPAEFESAPAATGRAKFAVGSVLVMVALMVSGVVPNTVAALIGCMLMGLTRCIDLDGAYRSIHWQSMVVIVGMMPFAIALERTGGVELAVKGLLQLLGDAGPHALLAALFVITAATGLFISNTATAILVAPLALSIAGHLGVSPRPFAVTVALAASAAFMTPVSSPVNTLVYGPGQYRFGDFVRVGVPFTLVVMIVTVLLVPWLFPLR
jgi:di/tricarboxylate transporter